MPTYAYLVYLCDGTAMGSLPYLHYVAVSKYQAVAQALQCAQDTWQSVTLIEVHLDTQKKRTIPREEWTA